jgi:hypothetical protein
MPQISEILERRNALVAATAAQREQLSFYGARLSQPLRTADQAFRTVRVLRSPLVAAALALLLRPRRKAARARERRGILNRVPGVFVQGWRLLRFLNRLRQ